jgi:hypothetical protein
MKECQLGELGASVEPRFDDGGVDACGDEGGSNKPELEGSKSESVMDVESKPAQWS